MSRTNAHEGVASLGRMALEGVATERLFERAVRLVAGSLEVPRASAVTFDEPESLIVLEACAGFEEGEVRDIGPPIERAAGVVMSLESIRAALAGGPLQVGELTSEDPLGDHLLIHGVRSYIAAPIGSPLRGYLRAAASSPRTFSAEEISFLQSVANVLGDALRRDEAERAMREAFERDELTGLANRRLMMEHLERALANARVTGSGVAVLLIDLDHFKVVNDSVGHTGGDVVLRALAPRLAAAAHASDTVARLGGDEFALVCQGLVSEEHAIEHARAMLAALEEPVRLGARELRVRASMGLAVDDGRTDAQGLLRDADTALHHAKARGRARLSVFSPAMRVRAILRMRTETDLAGAIERGELDVHYQPYFGLADRRLVGMEALMRWDRRGTGLVPPLEFIPLAEETGLIVPLGEWVLQRAIAFAGELAQRLPRLGPFELAINVSARQLEHESFGGTVRRALDQAGMAPSRLSLEITESMAMRGAVEGASAFERLKRLGVRLAIDDFGTGYSSLSRIGDLPLDTLKIDRGFVGGLGRRGRSDAIVRAIVAMADALGLDVIAEGVETETQLRRLEELGCDVVQGYLLTMPIDSDSLAVLLEGERGQTAG